MNNDELLDIILDEQKFPYANMSLSERNYYLNILRNCKDICDTDIKVDGESKCEIVQLSLKKESNVVNVNGFLTIGKNKKENRVINANIYLEKDKIIVDMQIMRLSVSDKNKKYTVLDEFKLKDDNLERRSQYNYDMKNLYESIENEEMKGRLK